jgi:Uri superfamily endonuclease
LRLNTPLPRGPGCYVLLVLAEGPVRVGAKTFQGTLAPGLYLYVGSAGGPGGLRARLLRHFRRRKRIHWHIDWLTTSPNAKPIAAAYCTGPWGVEAEAEASGCLEAKGYKPIKGFGATDDPHTATHLYQAPPNRKPTRALRDSLECLQKTTPQTTLCGTIQT